jgi:hypothetical protein
LALALCGRAELRVRARWHVPSWTPAPCGPRSKPIDTTYLYAIGWFGFLITLGLFIYELRAIQKCKSLEDLASRLERQLHLDEAQFIGRPKARLGGFVGAQGAAYIIYPTMLAAWIFVAFVGFTSPAQTPPVQTPAAQATRKQ